MRKITSVTASPCSCTEKGVTCASALQSPSSSSRVLREFISLKRNFIKQVVLIQFKPHEKIVQRAFSSGQNKKWRYEITMLSVSLVVVYATLLSLQLGLFVGFFFFTTSTEEKGKEQMQPSSLFLTAAKPLAPPLRVKAELSTVSNPNWMSASGATGPKWAQRTVTLPRHSRGCHLVTRKIVKEIEQDLSQFKCGLAHFFLHHTSASLTINENYDSDVREDTETFLNRIVPEGRSAPWKHTLEGPDDMPAHIKSSMFGCSLTIPITDGKLNMGQWQGIWLCEHRDVSTPRNIVVTLNGI